MSRLYTIPFRVDHLPLGMYFYVLTAGGYLQTMKLVVAGAGATKE